MNKFLLPLLLVLSAASLRAVAPIPFTLPVTYSGKSVFTAAGESFSVIYGEDGAPWSYRTTTGEASVEVVRLRPRKIYKVRCSGTNVSDYWASFNAPDGYVIYIDGSPTNLMSFHGLGSSFDEWADFELRPLASAENAEFGAFTGVQLGESVTWEVGLGALRIGGRSAGKVLFKEHHLGVVSPEPPIDSRDRLYYAEPGNYSDEIRFVKDGSSNDRVRQVGVPAGVLDFVDDPVNGGYSIKVYPRSQSTWGGSSYTFSGVPWKTIYVVSPAANQLRITDTEDGLVRVWHLALTNGSVVSGTYDWTLQEGKHVSGTDTWERITTHASVKSGSTRDNIVSVTHPSSSHVIAKTKFVYHTKAWGDVLAEVLADPDGAALKTEYKYYETAPGSTETHRGNYQRVKSVTYPTNGWSTFEYYDDWNRRGQLFKQVQPYKDSDITSPANGVTSTFDYVAGWSGRHSRPSVRTEQIGGVTTGKTEWTHGDVTGSGWPRENASVKSYSDATNFQTSFMERFRGDAGFDEPFLPLDQRNADDSRVVYSWASGGYNPSTKVFSTSSGWDHVRQLKVLGTLDGTGADLISAWDSQPFNLAYLVANKSVVQATITDSASRVVRTEVYVYTGSGSFTSAPVAYEDFTYNTEGKLTQRVASNGAVVSYTYLNGRPASVTAADGVVTEFEYDSLGRITKRTKKGADSWTINSYAHPA